MHQDKITQLLSQKCHNPSTRKEQCFLVMATKSCNQG
uniref:Uncharacterized protein n=1 Tax=Rhizophora mucronata TaxID=61149 RepID=A0A2P2PW15_RHIMU